MAEHPPGNEEDGVDPPDDVDLRIPQTASPEEAAAIAAAVEAYLGEERAATADGAGSRLGRPWALAARLERLTGRPGRIPGGAPGDAWSAAGRADRF